MKHSQVQSLSFQTVKVAFVSTLVLLIATCLSTPARAQFGPPSVTYYVSTAGDNSDGRTWETAFNELDQIPWDQMNPRDKIFLDGGQRRMIYRKTLNIISPGNHYGRFEVKLSSEEGHNGQVVIAPGPNANGITLQGGGAELNGMKKSGILIWRAKNGLEIIPGGPFSSNVYNLEIVRCTENGIKVGPGHTPVGLNQLLIHDNKNNVLAPGGSYPGYAAFEKCWIYNNFYRRNSDGIRFEGSVTSAPVIGVRMTNCVLGPGLRDGINNSTPAVPSLKNCLIINCTRNNVSSPSVYLENVTSFMTRRNPRGLSHTCVKLHPQTLPYPGPGSRVEKSIFFGGMVEAPVEIVFQPSGYTIPLPITVSENTQYRTTGNTTLLAENMVNPKFNSRVGRIHRRTPIHFLKKLDFSLRDGSPAQGTGSSVTSVSSLLGMFE